MSRTTVAAFIAGSLLGGVAVLSVVASQGEELDPVSLAPDIYEIALENEHVRVLKVTSRPGKDTRITVERYPEARHGFDIKAAPSVLDIGNGMTVGYQKAAAEASWHRILQFLSDGM